MSDPSRTSGRLWPLIWCAALWMAAFLAGPHELTAQGGTEILRGRVTTADNMPVGDAAILITGLTTKAVSTTHTNAKGVYTALFANAEGDYVLTVRKIGFTPVTLRVRRTGLTSVLVTNVTLTQMPVTLDSITSVSRHLPITGEKPSVGGVEQNILQQQIFALDPTDLVALAAQVAGILALGDSSFSVLGADADQNNATIDGAKFGGRNLPQDAIASARVIITSADPKNAGFTGGQTATLLRGGSDIFSFTTRGTFADSHLAWTDPDWPSPVPRIASTSGGIGGPIIREKLHYQGSWNLTDNSASVYSLLAPPASILSQYGLSSDTITAVSKALGQLGVPLTANGAPVGRDNRYANATLVLDYNPAATTSLRLTQSGYWGEAQSPGSAPGSFPSVGSSSHNTYEFASARLSGYVHGFLDELGSSLNYGGYGSQPFVQLPSANVRVGTVFDNGQTGLSAIGFGGGSGVSRGHSYNWDIQNEFSWLSPNSAHRVKVGQDLNYAWGTNFYAGNEFGSYSYQSLADLENNSPAAYNITLTSYERSSHGASTAFWAGDEWNVSTALQFQGGLRYDLAFPGTVPSYNPAVDTAFGLHTDRVPHTRFLTPRIGFSWTSKSRHSTAVPQALGNISLNNLPPGITPDMLRALLGSGPLGSAPPGIGVQGSIGAYGGVLNNGAIANLIDQTGLPNTRRALTCVGADVPIPDWSAIAGSPATSCLDGTNAAAFSANQPTVQVYDPSYQVPITWRGDLRVDGIRLVKRWTLAMTGFYSYAENLQSVLDYNLNRTPEFALTGEDNRPVYVAPDDIVAETGAIGPNGYRIDPAYGRVADVISDLHNYTRQVQASIAPPHTLFNNTLNLNFTYVLTNGRQQQRGLTGNTAGDPFATEWVRGNFPTHQFLTTAQMRVWWFNVNMRLNVYSGYPYTPMVVGDINGDGASDDRAFIANPATTADTALASQMRQLLAAAPGGARQCIESQFGQIAGAQSCSSEWNARLDFNINWQPPQSFGLGDRLRVTTNMLNTSGALVRLFGLEDTPLGRGALSAQVDNRLLYVTGFNPATNSFEYRVNQLFGEPVNFGNSRHRYAPFQMQMGLEYKLGGPPTSPMARSIGLVPADNTPALSADEVSAKLEMLSPNPLPTIVRLKDALQLTAAQSAALDTMGTQFRLQSDSLLAPLIKWVVKHGRRIDDAGLGSRLSRVQPALTKLAITTSARALDLLTPAQKLRLAAAMAADGTNSGGRDD